MPLHYLLDKAHQGLSRSSLAARMSVRIRNQVNCVIAYHLGETCDPTKNGEFALLQVLLPHLSVFVDVGANVGEWAHYIVSHRPGGVTSGFLYEPSLQCAGLLEKKFSGQNIRLRNVTVGDHPGTVAFREEAACGQGSSIVGHSETPTEPAGLRSVPMVTLDDELLGEKLAVDFLKIDTEGYDLHVLKGARQLLHAGRIRFIQFEYNSHWLQTNSTLLQARSFLEGELGLRLLLVRSTGLHPLDSDYWGEYYRYSNFFACRPADEPLVAGLIRNKI